jgi:hypothetical protein
MQKYIQMFLKSRYYKNFKRSLGFNRWHLLTKEEMELELRKQHFNTIYKK